MVELKMETNAPEKAVDSPSYFSGIILESQCLFQVKAVALASASRHYLCSRTPVVLARIQGRQLMVAVRRSTLNNISRIGPRFESNGHLCQHRMKG
jgi:hypothetical protein